MKKSLLVTGPLLVQLLAAPLAHAGNQNGPAWQQARPKAKDAAEAPAAPKKGLLRRLFSRDPKPDALPAPDPAPLSPSATPLPPARSVPEEAALPRAMPGDGALREEDLILLAIANRPALQRRRGDVAIARAARLGAGDLKNPELRIGYAWQDDGRIRSPFTERSTESISSLEDYSTSQSTRNLAGPGQLGNGESSSLSTSGRQRETRYRTIERRVTPGDTRDVIETTTYETRKSSDGSSRRSTSTGGGFTDRANEARNESQDRRIVEQSREVVNHPNTTGRDDQLSVLVRWDIPNPWDRKAKIEIAVAEIARAESDYLLEEDKVVREVRALCEELSTLVAKQDAQLSQRSGQEKTRTDAEALGDPELADLLAELRLEISKSGRSLREMRSDIERVREDLAAFIGLENPDRIQLSNTRRRQIVNVDSMDVDYLTSMAMLHRADLLDLQARQQVANAELTRLKAAKIPFFSFVDVGWSRQESEGRTGSSDEWGLRAGITLPFFDWVGINKAHKEFETATATYGAQIEHQQALIRNEIRLALGRIRSAGAELISLDKELAQARVDAERTKAENTAASLSKQVKLGYQNEDLISKFEGDRHEVWSDYNKAVMALETALGTRLDRVLDARGAGK